MSKPQKFDLMSNKAHMKIFRPFFIVAKKTGSPEVSHAGDKVENKLKQVLDSSFKKTKQKLKRTKEQNQPKLPLDPIVSSSPANNPKPSKIKKVKEPKKNRSKKVNKSIFDNY